MDTVELNKKIQSLKKKQEKFRLVYNDLVTNPIRNGSKDTRKELYDKIIKIEENIYSLQKL